MFDFTYKNYTLAVIGLNKKYNKSFASRDAANSYMYDLCSRYGLKINEVWNDHHDKTYHCTNGVTFYIQKAR